jgi:hypothetical protein
MNLVERAPRSECAAPGHGEEGGGLLPRREWWVVVTMVLSLWPGYVTAQPTNPLFNRTRQPSVIVEQVRHALPSAERGLALLASDADPSQLSRAVESSGDTYKYLAAASESTEDLMRAAKSPDPLAEMKVARMWEIRRHMLACTDQAGHIIKQDYEMIRMCTEHVTEGTRKLRILQAVMP